MLGFNFTFNTCDNEEESEERINEFTRRYNKYNNLVYKICIMRLGSKEDAEDALQNTFIKLYYKSPTFESDSQEKAWIIRVAINVCKDFQKSFWQKNTVGMEEITEMSCGGIEDRQKLIDIFSLSPKYRTVLQLYYYEGYSEKEIGEILHIAEKSVAMQLYRARKKLKLEMEALEYEK